REYQFEGYEMFQEMIESIKDEVATYIMKAHVESNLQREAVAEGQAVDPGAEKAPKKPVRREEKIGRNDPCPCGSGKKYKQCHGAGSPPASPPPSGGQPPATPAPAPKVT